MIFRRLLSNIIDFAIYIIVFFILFKISGLETDTNHLYYFYFISFLLTFIFPVFLIKNTIGKKITKLEWEDKIDLKLKLFTKYTLYYLVVAPSFSILSAISSFPLLNPVIGDFDKILSVQLFFALFITDIVVFAVSLGKHHIIDYALNLNLSNYKYRRKPIRFLYSVYLYFSVFFIFNLYSYKYNLSFSSIGNSLSSSFSKEQYPEDLFYGNYVFSLKEKSDGVFLPTKPLSFIYKQKLPQKTLYLNVPSQIFKSENDRKSICLDLIMQSYRNDMVSDFKPEQTRIVLSSIEQGIFLEYYNYFYIYYFDNDLFEWNVYGGIEADSITMKNYIEFNNNYTRGLLGKMENLEKKLNLTWEEIIEESDKNKNIENQVKGIYNSSFSSTLYYDKLIISLDTNKLKLNRIDFTDTKLNGYMNFNFPITELQQRVNLTNLINGEVLEYDENVDYLKLLREETTNKGI
jgi:hypothetical protein